MNYRTTPQQKINRELFALTGPNAREQMFEEPEGLRIVLPSDAERQDPIGLVTRFPIRGDFEITAAYEILRSDKPSAGYGTGPRACTYTRRPPAGKRSILAVITGSTAGKSCPVAETFSTPRRGSGNPRTFPRSRPRH